jgi:acetyltransferase-like isoleucine patch superfamily enzyme
MFKICTKKFKYFGISAEFRPGAYAICCSKISIGKRVVIRPGTMLFASPGIKGAMIIIEDDVLIGSGVHIYTGNHSFNDASIPIIDQGHDEFEDVILKKGCWLGANSIILPGVSIGYNSVVAAGAVVTKNVEDYTLVGGVPAKEIRKLK